LPDEARQTGVAALSAISERVSGQAEAVPDLANELYLVCGDLAGLEAGMYHFGPADFGLRRLRAGDIQNAPQQVFCTMSLITIW